MDTTAQILVLRSTEKNPKGRLSDKLGVSIAAAASLVYVKDISKPPVVNKIAEMNSAFFKSLAVSICKAVNYHE